MGDKRCNAFATFYSTNCAIDYVDDDIKKCLSFCILEIQMLE